ncbi:endoplasmic reticulum vesicle transporter [Pavlovales sp. CCMP2436]|nr:endoplasmic reticulum vesicle transporter [Pavlovales sp. CCMP2436]|mmetsp:Transcript_3276/g.8155  ORF Transcript_3276/g.8155 Transcript_3276/m.8155 type:complete len:102 (+) Transcript_3276:237-542(+)
MKVVPTIYEYSSGISVLSNQYSFTQIFRTTAETDKLPAVYFHYELSPIMAKFTVGARSFGSFLTGLCAIVGGVFTLSGVVDAIIFRLAAKVKPPATAHAAR